MPAGSTRAVHFRSRYPTFVIRRTWRTTPPPAAARMTRFSGWTSSSGSLALVEGSRASHWSSCSSSERAFSGRAIRSVLWIRRRYSARRPEASSSRRSFQCWAATTRKSSQVRHDDPLAVTNGVGSRPVPVAVDAPTFGTGAAATGCDLEGNGGGTGAGLERASGAPTEDATRSWTLPTWITSPGCSRRDCPERSRCRFTNVPPGESRSRIASSGPVTRSDACRAAIRRGELPSCSRRSRPGSPLRPLPMTVSVAERLKTRPVSRPRTISSDQGAGPATVLWG